MSWTFGAARFTACKVLLMACCPRPGLYPKLLLLLLRVPLPQAQETDDAAQVDLYCCIATFRTLLAHLCCLSHQTGTFSMLPELDIPAAMSPQNPHHRRCLHGHAAMTRHIEAPEI